MTEYFIYTLTNPNNNQVFYVGVTSDPKTRKRYHSNISVCRFRPEEIVDPKLNYITKHGIVPQFEILELVFGNRSEAMAVESFWKWQLKSWGFTLVNSLKKSKHKQYENAGN